jgi:hypothetical protein
VTVAEKKFTVVIAGDDRTGPAFKSADAGTNKLSASFKKLAGLAVAAFAVDKVKDFAVSSVKAFAESEKASVALGDAFSRFPKLADSNQKAFEKQADALLKVTRFDDEATKTSQALLAQFDLTGEQILKLTPLMLDFAAKTGRDLPDAAEVLGKAMLGQGRALKEVGIDFVDTGTVAGNLEQVMAGLRTQVGGFAEKEGETAQGKLEILKNRFGELQEKIGEKLMPVLISLATWLLEDGIPAFEKFTQRAVDGFHYISVKAIEFQNFVVGFVGFVADKFLWMGETVAAGIAATFGWIPGLGPKLQRGAEDIAKFRDEVSATIESWKLEIPLNPELERMYRDLGFINRRAQEVRDTMRGITDKRGFGGGGASDSWGGEFASGGVVPGPMGAPKLALVHGGETILPTHQSGWSGGMNVTIIMPPGSDGDDVVDKIREYERRNGTSWRN